MTCQIRVKRVQEIIRFVEQKQENASKNVTVQNDILYNKDNHKYPYWTLSFPLILKFLWSDMYLHRWDILAPKMHSSICQHFSCKGLGTESQEVYFSMWYLPTVRHPNSSCAVQNISHLSTKPSDVCAVDFNGHYLLDVSGLDIHLYVSTCFRNL